MSPKFVDKEEKKKAIGLSALSLFAKNGFIVTSMSNVAQAAGVGKGTIYEYFKSKDELVTYTLNYHVDAIEKSLAQFVQNTDCPKEMLRNYSLAAAEKLLSDPTTKGVILAINQLCISSDDPKHKTPLKPMFEKARNTIETILKKGVEDGVFKKKTNKRVTNIAINIVAYLDGICTHSLVSDDIDLKKQINYFLDDLFSTIGIKEGQFGRKPKKSN